MKELIAQLKARLQGSGTIQLVFFGAVSATLLLMAFGGIIFLHFSHGLPKIITVDDYRPPVVTEILAKDNQGKDEVIGEFYKERRYVIPSDKI